MAQKKLIIYFSKEKNSAFQVVQPTDMFSGDFASLAKAIAGECPITGKPKYYKIAIV